MLRKTIRQVIALIVMCALLAGCLAGCVIILNPDTSERPDARESKKPVSGDNTSEAPPTAPPAETSPAAAPPAGESPAAKTLRRETVTTDYGGRVSTVIMEYLESGLAARIYSAYNSDDEKSEMSYDYDAHGAPSRMRMDYDNNTEAVIEITNNYENGKLVSAQISDILLNGESALDAGVNPGSMAFYNYLSSLLRFLQHFEGYRDAEISIRNTEACNRLQNGEVVYSCSDMGNMKATTEITRDSNGHKTISVTTTSNTQITETDEHGRCVKFGFVVGQQSMMMQIEYEIQPGSDAHRRTEVGHVADVQNDFDTDNSDDQLKEMAAQYSFTYTFADDVLVFSQTDLVGTQKTTHEYSADGLLLRQATETHSESHTQSTVTEYEYQ